MMEQSREWGEERDLCFDRAEQEEIQSVLGHVCLSLCLSCKVNYEAQRPCGFAFL